MSSPSFRAPLRTSPIRILVARSSIALLLAGSAGAQFGQYRLLPQQQSQSQEQQQGQFDAPAQGQTSPDDMTDLESGQSNQLDRFGMAGGPSLSNGRILTRSVPGDNLETRDRESSDFDTSRPSAPVQREREKITQFQNFVRTST